jgi:hypothetical protein
MIASGVYLLCALTSLACAALLVRAYLGRRSRILFWTALCFCGLFANNMLLFVDLVVVPNMDLSRVRALTGLAAVAVLVYGLVSMCGPMGGDA